MFELWLHFPCYLRLYYVWIVTVLSMLSETELCLNCDYFPCYLRLNYVWIVNAISMLSETELCLNCDCTFMLSETELCLNCDCTFHVIWDWTIFELWLYFPCYLRLNYVWIVTVLSMLSETELFLNCDSTFHNYYLGLNYVWIVTTFHIIWDWTMFELWLYFPCYLRVNYVWIVTVLSIIIIVDWNMFELWLLSILSETELCLNCDCTFHIIWEWTMFELWLYIPYYLRVNYVWIVTVLSIIIIVDWTMFELWLLSIIIILDWTIFELWPSCPFHSVWGWTEATEGRVQEVIDPKWVYDPERVHQRSSRRWCAPKTSWGTDINLFLSWVK